MNIIPDDIKQFYKDNYHIKGKGLVHIDIDNNQIKYYYYSLYDITLAVIADITNSLSTNNLLQLIQEYNDKEEIVVSYIDSNNNTILFKLLLL